MEELIGQRIAQKRKERGITQEALSKKSGIGLSKLKHVEIGTKDENGYKRYFNTEELKRISEILDVSMYYLITGISDENHIINEELGLSNDVINTLKNPNSTVGKFALEILVKDWKILISIAAYLLQETDGITIWNDSEFRQIPLSDIPDISKDDLERISRLRVMDQLKRVKDQYKMEEGK